jgi:putative PIN family toxin of toxin-antitoxin system
MNRVVFDTVVFVRCLLNPASRWGRLVFEHHDPYHLFVSPPVMIEILEVLHRSGLRSRFSTIAGRDVNWVLARLGRADVVEIEAIPAVSRDPNDDMFLATAVAAGADYLVSEDQDLLVLGEYEGIRIIDAAAFLWILEHVDEQS